MSSLVDIVALLYIAVAHEEQVELIMSKVVYSVNEMDRIALLHSFELSEYDNIYKIYNLS